MCNPIQSNCTAAPKPEESAWGPMATVLGWTAAITALDQFVLQPLIRDGYFPEAARAPTLFAGVTGAQAALGKMGLASSSVTQMLSAMPTFTGFQVIARGLLNALGIKPGWGSEAASLTLAALPLFYAKYSPQLAGALEAAAAGNGLAEGASVGAAALQLGATAVRVMGWMSLLNFGGNWIADNIIGNLWAAGTGEFDTNKSLWNLERMCMQIYDNDHMGSFLSALLPVLPDNDKALREIRDDLVQTSDEVGKWLNANFMAVVFKNTRHSADQVWTTDWTRVQSDLKDLYQDKENETTIDNVYRLVDKATGPLTESGIRTVIHIIGKDGEIKDLERLKMYIRRIALFQYMDQKEKVEQKGVELGFAKNSNGEYLWKVPRATTEEERNAYRAQLSPEQDNFLRGDLSHWASLLMLAQSIKAG